MNEHTDISPDTSSNVSESTPSSSKNVHFELPPEDDASKRVQQEKPRPRRRRRPREPAYTPRRVFGLYLPRDLLPKIAFSIFPDELRDNPTEYSDKFLDSQGIQYASTYCRNQFPDIPLRWYHTVLTWIGDELLPVLVLGHMDSNKVITVDVTTEDMERMQDALGLGDQEPAWYPVVLLFS